MSTNAPSAPSPTSAANLLACQARNAGLVRSPRVVSAIESGRMTWPNLSRAIHSGLVDEIDATSLLLRPAAFS